MAHRIVLLNLADESGGLVTASANSLRKKYPPNKTFTRFGNQITQVSLFPFLEKQKKHTWQALSDPELLKARGLCEGATKIMLCTHGMPTDVGSAHANDSMNENKSKVAAIATYVDLANLTLAFLPSHQRVYNLALIMCYGARSLQYTLNHEGQLSPADLQSSFAYKFYRRICTCRNVRMTARTGAVGFDDNGRSEVQSEAAMDVDVEREEFLRLEENQVLIQNFNALHDRYNKIEHGANKETANAWVQIVLKFRQPQAVPSNPDEELFFRNEIMMKKKREFAQIANTGQKKKYGKYVYTYTPKSKLTIFSKYPAPGAILYNGDLM